jgi:hypothetical protein
MGCGHSLALGEGGILACTRAGCPRPDAAAAILADTESEHVVTFTDDGFTIRHPVRERLPGQDDLEGCSLHLWLSRRVAPLFEPGRYRAVRMAAPGMPGWHWTRLEESS